MMTHDTEKILGDSVMYILLAILGLVAALAGVVMLTEATLGVGVIAFGIFLVALSRVIQADRHNAKLLEKLK